MEAADQAEIWADLGTRWRILEQYFKPHPVCRWAQPAIEAAAALRGTHAIAPDAIERVTIRTFGHAVALGAKPVGSTEEAQYALGFPVACMLAQGQVGATEIADAGLTDPVTLAMLRRIRIEEDPALSARFPAERLATVELRLADGQRLTSPVTAPRGDPGNFLGEAEIAEKFDRLAASLPPATRREIVDSVADLDTEPEAGARFLSVVSASPTQTLHAAA